MTTMNNPIPEEIKENLAKIIFQFGIDSFIQFMRNYAFAQFEEWRKHDGIDNANNWMELAMRLDRICTGLIKYKIPENIEDDLIKIAFQFGIVSIIEFTRHYALIQVKMCQAENNVNSAKYWTELAIYLDI